MRRKASPCGFRYVVPIKVRNVELSGQVVLPQLAEFPQRHWRLRGALCAPWKRIPTAIPVMHTELTAEKEMAMRKRPANNPLALAKLVVEIGTKQVRDEEGVAVKATPSARKR